MTNILSLPEEVIEYVFSYLHVIPLMHSVYPASKKLNTIICESNSYWSSVEFFGWTDGYQDDDNFKIVNFKTKEIKPRNISSQALMALFKLVVPKFGHLFRDLNILFSSEAFPVHADTLKLISEHCNALKSLKIDTPIHANKEIMSGIVDIIAKSADTLEDLTVQGGFPHTEFAKISEIVAPKLKTLYLEEKDDQHHLSLNCDQGQLEKSAYCYKSLEHLYLGGIHCSKALLEKCFADSTKLKSVVFDQCYLQVAALSEFLGNSAAAANISHLEILYCSLDTDVIPSMNLWTNIFSKCTNLVNLLIYSCTVPGERGGSIELCFRDEDLRACLEKCKKLETLDIRNCNGIDGKFFKELPSAKKLETLMVETKSWNMSFILPENDAPGWYSRSLKNLCLYGDKCDSSLEQPVSGFFPQIEFIHMDKFA